MPDQPTGPSFVPEAPSHHGAFAKLTRSPFAWLCLLTAVAYAPIFWGDIIFFRDPAHWNYPARAFVRRALLSGEFPNWNPFVGLGVPVWANPLYATLYPPNWLLLLVPERLVAAALTWQSAAHTLWGGIGLYLLARGFRCRPIACLVAGLAWSLSGYTTSMWSAGLLLIAGAWLPWVAVGMLSATKGILAGGSLARALPKIAVPLALAFLTGEVFVALLSAGFGIATLAAWWFGVEHHEAVSQPRTKSSRVVVAVTAGIGIALLIGSIVIAPARALVAGTPRGQGVALADAERFSFHPIRVLEFLAPQALGVPLVNYPGANYAGEPSIDGMPLAFSSYLGASVLALCLFAFGGRRRASWIVAGLWVCFLFVCFGRYTPVHAAWRLVVLPFKYMRYPEKYVVLLVGWASLLAAIGFHRVLAEAQIRGRRLLGFLAMNGAVALGVGMFVQTNLAQQLRSAFVFAMFAVASLFALLWLHKKQSRMAEILFVAVVAFDLMANAWEFQPFRSGANAQRPSPMAAAIQSMHRESKIPPRLYRSMKVDESVLSQLPERSGAAAEALTMLALTPNVGSVFGVATVPGYDAAKPKAIEDLWAEGLPFQATLLRLLAVDFALLPVREPGAPDARTAVYEPLMDPAPGARLYRVKETLPRAYLAATSMVLNDAQTLSRIFTPDVSSGSLVLVAAGQGHAAIKGAAKFGKPCAIQSFSLNHVAITCDAEEPSLAVLVEQHSSGWSATIDGVPANILRVNHVMRGVPVGAGTHQLEMHYHPPVSLWAIAASLAGLATIFVLFIATRVSSKRKRAPEGPLAAVSG